MPQIPRSFLPLSSVLAIPFIASAQHTRPFDLGATYTYTRTNILPGCSCVSLNGGSAEAQYRFTRHLAALADFSAGQRSGITPDGYSLTQFTYTAGLRYFPLRPAARLRPFAEASIGGAHAGGTLSPSRSGVGGSSNAFALQAGGGLQVRVGHRITLQPIQADYLFTTFSNTMNNRQNDLRLSSGILFRLGR